MVFCVMSFRLVGDEVDDGYCDDDDDDCHLIITFRIFLRLSIL